MAFGKWAGPSGGKDLTDEPVNVPKVGSAFRHKQSGSVHVVVSADKDVVKTKFKGGPHDGDTQNHPAWIFSSMVSDGNFTPVSPAELKKASSPGSK